MTIVMAVIVGIETVRDKTGKVIKLSETFLNNSRTIQYDYPENKVIVIDAMECIYKTSPMEALMARLVAIPVIDSLTYCGHSDSERLYVFSHVRTELENHDRYIQKNTDWSEVAFAKDAKIFLTGCQAGGQKKVRFDECIAQWIADSTRCKTLAYSSKTSQQKRFDGRYVQVPDYHFVETFDPRK